MTYIGMFYYILTDFHELLCTELNKGVSKMKYIKQAFCFSVMACCAFVALAKDGYIYFAHYPGIPKSERHSYTIKFVGSGRGMYGVYNPGMAHLSKNVADVDLNSHTPPDYVRVHWQSTLRQSYQDFVVTQDDNPSMKATFRWYKPYADQAYITVFQNPGHVLTTYQHWGSYSSFEDTLLYVN